jgi:micrococcal nuclease
MRYLKRNAFKFLLVTLNAIAIFLITNVIQNPQVTPVNTENNRAQISISPTPQVAGEQTEEKDLYLVTRVIDGDTIQLEDGRKVRYIGIDAPEVSGDCFAPEATNKNKELVLNKKVSLLKDKSEVDRYGRLLRYVYVDDIFVNNTLVREGFALAKKYPPDTKFAQQFTRAEEEARDQRNGLWGMCKK